MMHSPVRPTAFFYSFASSPHRSWFLVLGLGLLLLTTTYTALARPPRRYVVPGHELPVALLTAGKATYLVTEHSVFRQQGRAFVRHYQSAAPISRALVTDSLLWLGTQQGLVRLGTHSWQARPLVLPGAGPAAITALFRDAAGELWVGATGQGVYKLRGDELQSQLRIPAVNAGLATADSSVWIATNIGLYRWQHQAWTRYNEEGVANHEIPDNIVENLLLDTSGSLWVLMSEAISVFESAAQSGASEAHVPTIKYLGRPGNEVYSVAVIAGQGHIFATAMGLLLFPPQPRGELAHVEPSSDRIETPQMLIPLTGLELAAPGACLIQVDSRQQVWLASPGEVRVWSVQAFRKAMRPASKATVNPGSTT
ncbi:hypothetical protein GO988_21095 [Hymenobacter sp. HMF4947]|uniref:Transcriptional regulator n=1 Tax=Hymenobacter ginkgonis TaxID=2682976 RepID=A0A7K1TK98_9BACT|nr:hypothetical protein [Hymenobacter ginkgonis]MVN78835.1 hypothetical protein [Hymenobacter ginkgonis]